MTGTAWEHAMAQTFFNAVNPNDALVLPWESGPMKEIFSPYVLPPLAKANGDASNLRDLKLDESAPVVGHRDSVFSGSPVPAYMTAVRNLKDTEYMENKRAQIDLSVAKWMDLLSVNWDSSSVGRQLKIDLQSDPSGHYAEATLQSVFGVKSPTTLLKRAASMAQFMKWFAKESRKNDVHIGLCENMTSGPTSCISGMRGFPPTEVIQLAPPFLKLLGSASTFSEWIRVTSFFRPRD